MPAIQQASLNAQPVASRLPADTMTFAAAGRFEASRLKKLNNNNHEKN